MQRSWFQAQPFPWTYPLRYTQFSINLIDEMASCLGEFQVTFRFTNCQLQILLNPILWPWKPSTIGTQMAETSCCLQLAWRKPSFLCHESLHSRGSHVAHPVGFRCVWSSLPICRKRIKNSWDGLGNQAGWPTLGDCVKVGTLKSIGLGKEQGVSLGV